MNGNGNGGGDGFEDGIYEQFPAGDTDGNGSAEGFNTWVWINDRSLFTEEALENPAIRAFVDAADPQDGDRVPLFYSYAQFKSSHREAEYWAHKPVRAMTENAPGINGMVEGFPSGGSIMPTLVVNHENTLAIRVIRSVVVADGKVAGQLVHKER